MHKKCQNLQQLEILDDFEFFQGTEPLEKWFSKTLQILVFRPRLCKTFSRLTFLGLITLEKFKITLEQIFLTVGQINYGNKIPFFILRMEWKYKHTS